MSMSVGVAATNALIWQIVSRNAKHATVAQAYCDLYALCNLLLCLCLVDS